MPGFCRGHSLPTPVGSSGNSLVGSSHLITKVYFPRMIIPASAILCRAGRSGDLVRGHMAALMVWYGVPISGSILMMPILVLLTAILALGVGMWLSALHVRYRDIRYLIPFLIQFWMFATPVIYPASLLPERYRMLYFLNPMSGLIEAYRVALLGGVNGAGFNPVTLGMAGGLAILMLIYAIYNFRRMEKTFADIV
jgi:lipopolysaccharide transport system permease protein